MAHIDRGRCDIRKDNGEVPPIKWSHSVRDSGFIGAQQIGGCGYY